jgi:protease-4
MGDVAASGGYYIAMAAGAIVAQPGTLTGSIGVYGGKFSLEGLYRKIGIHTELLKRGRHAALFSSSRPWSEEERQKLRSLHRAFYDDFVAKVAEGRSRTPEEIEAVARGRVWTGAAAVEAGLVDELGGLGTALAIAKERAGLDPEQVVEWVVLPAPKGLLEVLLQDRDDALLGDAPRELRVLLRWERLLSEARPLLRAPFDVSIH